MLERKYYLGFSNFPGVGPKKFDLLLKNFGSAKTAWNSSSLELKSLLGERLTAKFDDFRKTFEIEKYVSELLRKKISFVCLSDDLYPKLLKQIPNPPIVLYVKGNGEILKQVQNDKEGAQNDKVQVQNDKAVAIVGTRRITAYGRSVTELFAGSLAQSGLTIVSGLALGVDGVAHIACLDFGGKTVAVLGNGVDICYPRENQKIYDRILSENGAIISEYPPGETPSIGSFPARNRIVAGLSDGVLVTEGASDSGSLITANFGLEFGRKVFAVPGPITSSLSAAPLRLIEKGAKLVITPDDVTRELGIMNHELRKNAQKFAGLSSEEKKIIEILENESLQFDEIVRRLNLDPSKVGSLLSIMEMKGMIKNSGGNYLIINS